MRTFLIVWFGQLVSHIGSGLSSFALGVWVYEETQSVTDFALISLCIYLPHIITSPVAGAIVDRWNRRYAMILSDAASGIGTVAIWILLYFDKLEIWHIYIAVAINSFFNSFQWPAYSSATTTLVPKKDLGKANGLLQSARAAAKIIAPTMAGFLVKEIQIEGVMFIDFMTFLCALGTLLCVRFPKPEVTDKTPPKLEELFQDTVYAWKYITIRPGLFWLLIFLAVTYFNLGVLQVVFWPMMLSFADSKALGMVLSIGGCGWLLGSVMMSAWGGPKRRVYGIYLPVIMQGICLLFGGVRTSVPLVAIGVFGYLFAYPIAISCNRAIWQTKIPLELQGRVFALDFTIEKAVSVLAYVISGPLVDTFLDPILAPGGLLATTIVGDILGVGKGRGIGLLFVSLGIITIMGTFFAYRYPRVRRVEKELPDAI
ncbi:MAG TPA: MFS transporter [Oscillatoriaceae cyanobacterium M33_DOE_052]|uniref:MFS transporter n=1 Tax=Planktothricoides sp. SpSt-374 TaxID=2282167 RepID=A0A7C3VQW2_9CYAN|nr:MFS transporter [Oscillatoriaceae cyanobacterium M33_DOE_052]